MFLSLNINVEKIVKRNKNSWSLFQASPWERSLENMRASVREAILPSRTPHVSCAGWTGFPLPEPGVESPELPLQPLQPAGSTSLHCLLRSHCTGLQCLLHGLPRGPVVVLSSLELLAKMLRASIICALSGFKFQKKLSSTRCCLQPLLHGLRMV